MTVRESEFSEADLLVLLASRWADAQPRGRHGVLLSDATDPARRDDWVVDLPSRDFLQQKLDREQAAYEKLWGRSAEMSSLLWRVRSRDVSTQ